MDKHDRKIFSANDVLAILVARAAEVESGTFSRMDKTKDENASHAVSVFMAEVKKDVLSSSERNDSALRVCRLVRETMGEIDEEAFEESMLVYQMFMAGRKSAEDEDEIEDE
jgi:hypothetical protein